MKNSKNKRLSRAVSTSRKDTLAPQKILQNDKSNAVGLSQDMQHVPILPNITKASQKGLFGCVDVINDKGIAGWYLNVEKNDDRGLIEISVAGITLGHAQTGDFRSDISDMFGIPIHCGFKFNWGQVDKKLVSDLKNLLPEDCELAFEFRCIETRRSVRQHDTLLKVTKEQFFDWILSTGQEFSTYARLVEPYEVLLEEKAHSVNSSEASMYEDEILCNQSLGSELTATVLGLTSRTLYGWVAEQPSKSLTAVELAIYVDDIFVAKTPGIHDTSFPMGKLRFEWKIPKNFFDGKVHRIDLYQNQKRGSKPLTLEPFFIGPQIFDSKVEHVGGGRIVGYFIERVSESTKYDILIRIDTKDAFEIKCDKVVRSNVDGFAPQRTGGFEFILPNEYLDGLPHRVDVIYAGKTYSSTFALVSMTGHIDILNCNEVSGWIYDTTTGFNGWPLDLDLLINGKYVKSVSADISRNDVGGNCGFHADISKFTQGNSSFSLKIVPSGTSKLVLDTPVSFFRKDAVIEFVRHLAEQARNGDLNIKDDEISLLVGYLGAKLIDQIRNSREEHQIVLNSEKCPKGEGRVSVIVPVYDGVDETIRCLGALFDSQASNCTPFDVVLIDDCGPSPAIRTLLRKYQGQAGVRLICNEVNLGFVKSVNKALIATKGHDVVLLNADAVVHGNWLDRLRRAAYSSASVASVTPFSNNATICSYPDPTLENSIPEGTSLAELDSICQSENSGVTVCIPSGIGFCMYMRADAIREVGGLDAEKFGFGYGEENDWCIRARDLGWKHLHACDTFVEHIGGVSFGKDKKSDLVEKNLKVLASSYPEYVPLVMDFIRNDPSRLPRNRITIKRIKDRLVRYMSRVLYVMHSLGGGIDIFCQDMARRLRKEHTAVLMLESRSPNSMVVKFEELEATYQKDRDFNALLDDLKKLGLTRAHFNSDVGHELDVWKIPESLDIPFDVTIHDYLFVCPRVNFVTPDGAYCGEPMSSENCTRCVKNNGTFPQLEARFLHFDKEVDQWRTFYFEQLRKAESLFAPDEDAAERISQYFPALKITVQPHPLDENVLPIAPPKLTKGKIMRVGVLGAIGPHKGFNALRECVRNAHQLNLPLHFVVVGYTSNDEMLSEYPNVTITGKYAPERLQEILADQELHAALFLSPWPETYSYTLTEALVARIFPVVLPIGAQAARVRRMNIGLVLEDTVSPSGINRALVSLAFNDDNRSVSKKTNTVSSKRLVTKISSVTN